MALEVLLFIFCAQASVEFGDAREFENLLVRGERVFVDDGVVLEDFADEFLAYAAGGVVVGFEFANGGPVVDLFGEIVSRALQGSKTDYAPTRSTRASVIRSS